MSKNNWLPIILGLWIKRIPKIINWNSYREHSNVRSVPFLNSFPACFFLLLLWLDRLSTRNFVPDISHKKEIFFFRSRFFSFYLFHPVIFFLNLLRFFVTLWTALVLKFDYFIAILLIDGNEQIVFADSLFEREWFLNVC